MSFRDGRSHSDLFVPDGESLDVAMARTTDLAIVAHQDDLELLALAPIAACLADPHRWFTGVTCSDGSGSARTGDYADWTDEQMIAERCREQREAATIGSYSAALQLGFASASLRGDGHSTLVDQLTEILDATRPVNVYTHNLADKHDTHLAVVAATVRAVRALDPPDRPWRLVGIEGWRGLDWLTDNEKVLLDVSGDQDLAARLVGVFASQLEGGKRYDLAEEGRRRANATLFDPRSVDAAEQVTFAMDLTPLIHNSEIDPVVFVTAAIDRFRAQVVDGLAPYFP